MSHNRPNDTAVDSWYAMTNEDVLSWRNPCTIEPYQIRYFQIGTGGASSLAVSSTISLGSPLTNAEYGGGLRSVNVVSGMLYSEASAAVETQAFSKIQGQGTVVSSLVTIIHLDEETANGQLIDECGLFVDNPYLKLSTDLTDYPRINVDFSMLGGDDDSVDNRSPLTYETPGQLLAAYKKLDTPIQKESYFSLLIRWRVNFSIEP